MAQRFKVRFYSVLSHRNRFVCVLWKSTHVEKGYFFSHSLKILLEHLEASIPCRFVGFLAFLHYNNCTLTCAFFFSFSLLAMFWNVYFANTNQIFKGIKSCFNSQACESWPHSVKLESKLNHCLNMKEQIL